MWQKQSVVIHLTLQISLDLSILLIKLSDYTGYWLQWQWGNKSIWWFQDERIVNKKTFQLKANHPNQQIDVMALSPKRTNLNRSRRAGSYVNKYDQISGMSSAEEFGTGDL